MKEQYNINTNISELIYGIKDQIQSVVYDYLMDENRDNPLETYNWNIIWLDCYHINYIKVTIFYNKENNNINIKLETKEEVYTYNINCNEIINKMIELNIISSWRYWFRSFVIDRITEIKY